MKTDENLQKSFAARAMASVKNYAFAIAADKEGYREIAKLYRALSAAERVHAINHLKTTGELGTTSENLTAAIDSKSYDYTQLYPIYIEQSDNDESSEALGLFRDNIQTSKTHVALLNEALRNMIRFREHDYWVCQNCGCIEIGDLPLTCKICNGTREKFVKVD